MTRPDLPDRATPQPGLPLGSDLRNLAWVFLRNEADNTVEVSVACAGGYAYRRKLNLQTGRALYARAARMNAPEAEWIAVDAHSGQPLVGFVPMPETTAVDANPMPLDEDEYEPTVVTHGGTPTEPDDPCSIAVADDPQANWGQS